ncbi:biosynthetic-type acetolactate synthase large subunit [Marinicella rhabdoformis]|uniref:biosynthetic-type acetolactate synthase large subunit n=1 Tax=Marinicella rhabdoformis TaxID=2580566 RepID=UPI001C550A15|nr:biosynthetic-type acetolactate synthase large subunit [Marinicella rhabdoformis]
MADGHAMTGADALIHSLDAEGVTTIFGYPGGAIMPVYDALERSTAAMKHVLMRHEQGAVHAAQGWARVKGQAGVCFATSGPGAANLLTGIADAYMDSTPVVCITGQVFEHLLGSDAFQELDVISMAAPVTKWCIQVTQAADIAPAVAKAFYVAQSGRPGPVLIDITKNAQMEVCEWRHNRCISVPAYQALPKLDVAAVEQAAELINQAQKPLLIFGQGVTLSGAESLLSDLLSLLPMPAASTALGLSALPSDHPCLIGMLGMHGHYAANKMTNECDVLIAMGMRFDDRVTSDLSKYARQAKVVHFDIDASEINKNVATDVAVVADLKASLASLMPHLKAKVYEPWWAQHNQHQSLEQQQVTVTDLVSTASDELMTMAVVVRALNEQFNDAIWVTDVGQHQMVACRYAKLKSKRCWVTSGGLGTMGFCLPAALGAQMAAQQSAKPKPVVAVVGDGGLQMTVQEMAVLKQHQIPVKVVVMNNEYLGMVRQWQELYFEQRYAETAIENPDFCALAAAYGIDNQQVDSHKALVSAITTMANHNGPYLLEVRVKKEGNVFPIITPGASVSEMQLSTVMETTIEQNNPINSGEQQ